MVLKLLIGVLTVSTGLAAGECVDPAAVETYLADFRAARVSRGLGSGLTMAGAECARARLVEALPQVLGRRVGYKAGLTNRATQERYGVKGPAWGVMFEKMMAGSGATVAVRSGARLHYEPDLVAVVKDAGLADAATTLEALRHLSDVAPFLELPDLMVEAAPTASELVAGNVAFRGGVLGPRVKVEPTQAFLDALAGMTVVTSEDGGGKELGRVPGRALMDHPVHAALWLARALREAGIELRPGDLLSLGGFLPPAPAQPGTRITVRYLGLPGDPSVTVRFE